MVCEGWVVFGFWSMPGKSNIGKLFFSQQLITQSSCLVRTYNEFIWQNWYNFICSGAEGTGDTGTGVLFSYTIHVSTCAVVSYPLLSVHKLIMTWTRSTTLTTNIKLGADVWIDMRRLRIQLYNWWINLATLTRCQRGSYFRMRIKVNLSKSSKI